ncbi:hypothetical protein [Archangium violaceum]|uniref:hypothetical protein n=1 Tax=Archangium violaceum TaxID=83451 RepID=UPI0036DE06AD
MKRARVLPGIVALLCLTACMSFVGGRWGISPSQFQFRSIVPRREPGPGGWKSARVTIQLLHVTPEGIHRNVTCPIEVQVPEFNKDGVVLDEIAQLEAAVAADISAEWALKQGGFSEEMCRRFRTEMERILVEAIGGARVVKAL